jgi:hypothetical protein
MIRAAALLAGAAMEVVPGLLSVIPPADPGMGNGFGDTPVDAQAAAPTDRATAPTSDQIGLRACTIATLYRHLSR